MLRRDGFASLDATESGTLTTRPVRFTGKHPFVNAEAKNGALTVDVLDERGAALPRLSQEQCVAVRADRTRQEVVWKTATLAAAGKTVRFRFHLQKARLFSFWVSRQASGASQGYVAAGGPGLTNRCT